MFRGCTCTSSSLTPRLKPLGLSQTSDTQNIKLTIDNVRYSTSHGVFASELSLGIVAGVIMGWWWHWMEVNGVSRAEIWNIIEKTHNKTTKCQTWLTLSLGRPQTLGSLMRSNMVTFGGFIVCLFDVSNLCPQWHHHPMPPCQYRDFRCKNTLVLAYKKIEQHLFPNGISL